MQMQPSETLTVETLRSFPNFAEANDRTLETLLQSAIHKSLPAGVIMCRPGDDCAVLPVVLRGGARVFAIGESGREITLYRLLEGNACVLAAASILSQKPASAFSQTEVGGDALLIPADYLRAWVDADPFWRSFVFNLINDRLASILEVTNQAAFGRLDQRIASHLLEKGNGKTGKEAPIRTTHQEIASELGSSREVVSRLLKSFEGQGLVRLSRGEILLQDPSRLAVRAGFH
jgi:CRP/FNR family transcriptional regulator